MADTLENNSECPSSAKKEASAGGLSMLESLMQENKEDDHVMFEDSVFAGHLQDGLHSLRLEDSLTDVNLHVQGQSFQCHRVVLAAASHYFRSANSTFRSFDVMCREMSLLVCLFVFKERNKRIVFLVQIQIFKSR